MFVLDEAINDFWLLYFFFKAWHTKKTKPRTLQGKIFVWIMKVSTSYSCAIKDQKWHLKSELLRGNYLKLFKVARRCCLVSSPWKESIIVCNSKFVKCISAYFLWKYFVRLHLTSRLMYLCDYKLTTQWFFEVQKSPVKTSVQITALWCILLTMQNNDLFYSHGLKILMDNCKSYEIGVI